MRGRYGFRYAKKRRSAAPFFLAVLFILVVIAALLADSVARPVIRTVAQSRASNYATALINDTVYTVLDALEIGYGDIVTIAKDSNGYVTAVTTDSLLMNRIKTGVASSVARVLGDVKTVPIQIPLGSLTGSSVLSGRGPDIPFHISLSGSAAADIENVFVNRGINQTLHQIVLVITASVYVITFGTKASLTVSTHVTVAETVIVGLIPEIYAGADDNLWPNLIDD